MKTTCKLLLPAVLLLTLGLWAQDSGTQQGAPPTAPDNTKTNQRDRNGSDTADQQKENQTDRELTRQIRRAIMQDKSLSTYGHNVKIISQGGMVTLKGPVKSEEEKMAIEQKAAEVAGGSEKIQSQLEVAGGK
jgi:osmotically-inducible protein OsmY